ncbi:MAG: riboflavin synthase [Candidatus Omnitrophota bacterium]|jgi:riboflavin synthase
MYSGIVTNQGIVIRRELRGTSIRFIFRFKRKEKPIKLGESIAVDGVCLTVAGLTAKGFAADVVRETLEATTLGALRPKDRVNLERSLKVGDEIGGHFVTGHIDGAGRIAHIEKRKKNWLITFEAPKAILSCLAQKGSVAVDGISLTVQSLAARNFKITIIPHTLKETTLGRKGVGDHVNLEIDLITRYLKVLTSAIKPPVRQKMTVHPGRLVKYLKSQGF